MAEMELQKGIRMVIETGKVEIGSRRTLAYALNGGAKLILVASNSPKSLKEEIAQFTKKSNTPMKEVPFTSIELGSICGKPYPIMLMSVLEQGDSEILKMAETSTA